MLRFCVFPLIALALLAGESQAQFLRRPRTSVNVVTPGAAISVQRGGLFGRRTAVNVVAGSPAVAAVGVGHVGFHRQAFVGVNTGVGYAGTVGFHRQAFVNVGVGRGYGFNRAFVGGYNAVGVGYAAPAAVAVDPCPTTFHYAPPVTTVETVTAPVTRTTTTTQTVEEATQTTTRTFRQFSP